MTSARSMRRGIVGTRIARGKREVLVVCVLTGSTVCL